MKKVLLSIALLVSAYAYTVEPVHGAVYAEIRGVSGGRIRIYKGAAYSHKLARNIFSKVWAPTLCFFDKHGCKLVQEEFPDARLLDQTAGEFSWKKYDQVIQDVRLRLTQKPKVDHAKVVRCIKAANRKSIELFDKHGMLIAQTDFGFWGALKEGDALPQEAINVLSDYVRNPALLSSLKLTEVQITLRSLLFGK